MERPRVLFVDQTNASRSQMAEALLRHYGDGRYDVFSAGIEHGDIPTEAADVLREQGVALPATNVTVDELRHMTFDYVITVCDEDEKDCPPEIDVPGEPEKMRWRFSDPFQVIGDRIASLRRVRDEILNRIRFFILTDRMY